MQPTHRPQTLKKIPQINWTPKHNRWPLPTVESAARIAQNGRATVVLLEKPFHSAKNHDRCPQIFTYQPLNFQENMFVVHILHINP
jgi:hypothetical protein